MVKGELGMEEQRGDDTERTIPVRMNESEQYCMEVQKKDRVETGSEKEMRVAIEEAD
jgi:hypothetical protein